MNEVICNSLSNDDYDTYWYEDECYIIIDINEQICSNELSGSWVNNECLILIEMNENVCDELEGIWQNDECFIICTSNEACCNTIQGSWNGNECIDDINGFIIVVKGLNIVVISDGIYVCSSSLIFVNIYFVVVFGLTITESLKLESVRAVGTPFIVYATVQGADPPVKSKYKGVFAFKISTLK